MFPAVKALVPMSPTARTRMGNAVLPAAAPATATGQALAEFTMMGKNIIAVLANTATIQMPAANMYPAVMILMGIVAAVNVQPATEPDNVLMTTRNVRQPIVTPAPAPPALVTSIPVVRKELVEIATTATIPILPATRLQLEPILTANVRQPIVIPATAMAPALVTSIPAVKKATADFVCTATIPILPVIKLAVN